MSQTKSHLTIRQQGSISIVGFLTPSILDQATVNSIGAEMMELVELKGRKRLLIDLTGVKYFSSSRAKSNAIGCWQKAIRWRLIQLSASFRVRRAHCSPVNGPH